MSGDMTFSGRGDDRFMNDIQTIVDSTATAMLQLLSGSIGVGVTTVGIRVDAELPSSSLPASAGMTAQRVVEQSAHREDIPGSTIEIESKTTAAESTSTSSLSRWKDASHFLFGVQLPQQMGNSSSADPEARLQSPSSSMRALDFSWITQAPTRLHVKASLGGTSATVTDTATNAPIYTFKDKFLSSRTFLKGPGDQTLVTIKATLFSSEFHIFLGDQTEHEQFMLRDVSGVFHTMLLTVEYYDNKTGCPCRVVARGSPSKSVVVCFLEIGSPRLSPLKNSEDFQTNFDCYRPIGRFSRVQKFMGHDEYYIEAPPGADLTLLLLIWHVRQILLVLESSRNN